MRDQVIVRLRQILIEDFRVQASFLRDDARLGPDLRLDSLSLIDLIYVVQKDFGFKAHMDDFRELYTVGQLADFIVAKVAAAPRPRKRT